MIYIVLGMHKSGTSLVSKMLHESGINMGMFDSRIDYYNGQKYERNEIHEVIVNMLNAKNIESLDTIPPFNKNLILKNLPLFISIVHECNSNYDLWGFKNPRTIFIYDYIKPYLGEHKLICIYRNLEEVIAHYSQYSIRIRYILNAIKAWKIYNDKMIDILAEADVDFILLNYERIMSDYKQLIRLESFLNLKIKDCRIQSKNKAHSWYKKVLSRYISNLLVLLNIMELKTIFNKLASLENR